MPAHGGATPSIYEKALSRQYSRLVIIHVIDDRTGEERTICTFIDFLLRALQAEAGVAESAEAEGKARKIALKTKNQTFHFRKEKALQFFPYRSDQNVLKKVRQALRMAPRAELIGLFQDDREHVFIDRRNTFWESAQGLIEIGILPSSRCVGSAPLLWIEEGDLEQADEEKLKQWKAATRGISKE